MEPLIFTNTRLETTVIVKRGTAIDHVLSDTLEQRMRSILQMKKSFFCSTNPDSAEEEGTIEASRSLKLPEWSVEMTIVATLTGIRQFRVAQGMEEALNMAAQWSRLTLEAQS